MSGVNGEDLPPGWVTSALSEVAQINPPLDRCVVNDDVPVTFIPMRAVEPEGGGVVSPEIRCYAEVKKGYTSFLSKDVIMAKITPCMENGKTAVVPDVAGQVCFGSTEFHAVRSEQGIEPKWIAQFLLQHEVRRSAQRQMSGGVGQMRVPASFLETVRVPVAPSAEQVRVTDALDELFSDLDAAVAALGRARAKLKLYRASVLKAAVEGLLTAEWRTQHPHTESATELLRRILIERRRRWEEEQLARFKANGQVPLKNWKAKYQEPVTPDIANMFLLPEGWCWASLDQVFRVERGRFSVRPRNDPRYYGGSMPFVQIAELPREGGTIRNHTQTLNKRGVAVSKKFPAGTVLIAIVGATIGNTGILGFESCRPDSLVALQSSLSIMLRYSELYLRTRKLIMRIGASASGGQPNINLGLLQPMPFPLPPLAEAEWIVETVEGQLSVIDHLEADIEAKLKSARSLRQSILRHAFTGQLVPQDPNDEPASGLVKRIADDRAACIREGAAGKRPTTPTAGRRTTKRGRPRKVLETA